MLQNQNAFIKSVFFFVKTWNAGRLGCLWRLLMFSDSVFVWSCRCLQIYICFVYLRWQRVYKFASWMHHFVWRQNILLTVKYSFTVLRFYYWRGKTLIFCIHSIKYAFYSTHSCFDAKHWLCWRSISTGLLFKEVGFPYCINTLESYFILFIYFFGFRGVRDGVKGWA